MKKWIVLPILIGFLATSCTASSGSKPKGRESNDDIKTEETQTEESPEEEVKEVEMDLPQAEKEISDLKNRIEALERNFIDVRMDYISRINNLEIQLAEQSERTEMILKGKASKLPKRSMRARKALKPAVKKKAATIISGKKKIESSYEKAVRSYKEGNFSAALAILNNIIVGEMQKSRQDNIFYWKGMCQFQLNQYASAIMNFSTVIENYPTENKYYDSKLMVAITHGMLGDKSLAINELTRLLDEKIPQDVKEKANKAILEFQR